MKAYLAIRDSNKAAWLAHHESIWERMGLCSPWGHFAHPDVLRFFGVEHPEDGFHKLHAAITQALAKHGQFDTSFDYSRHAWDFRVVPDSCEQGYKVQATFQWDKQALWWGVLAAVLGIVITILCPPLALLAGLLGTVIVGVAMLIMAECAAEFVTGSYGTAETGGYLNSLAAQAVAA